MMTPRPKTKYVLMDETSYSREYKKAFDQELAKETVSSSELEAEFDLFDKLVNEALSKRWDSSSGSETHFEIMDEWQHTFHHCGGIYSKQIYCPDYVDALLDVMAQLPRATLWTYHTACECGDLWFGEFFVRYPNVYFPKDGKDYIGSFVPRGIQVEHFCSSDPNILAREAAIDGDIAKLQQMLETDPSLIVSKDDLGNTLLHHASAKGHLSILHLLLQSGADLEAKNNFGETALIRAGYGTSPITTLPVLLNAGAEVNLVSDFGHTPLSSHASEGIGSLRCSFWTAVQKLNTLLMMKGHFITPLCVITSTSLSY